MQVSLTDGAGTRLGGGKGSDILEHPLNAVVWLAQALAQEGLAMQPGDLISLGSFSPCCHPRPACRSRPHLKACQGRACAGELQVGAAPIFRPQPTEFCVLTDLHIHHTRLTPQMRGVLQGMAALATRRCTRAPKKRARPTRPVPVCWKCPGGTAQGGRLSHPRARRLPHACAALRTCRGGGAALPLLLYLHGGGFTIGSIATHDVLCRELARLSGRWWCRWNTGWRRSTGFPTASNDAWDALAWLAQHAATLAQTPPPGGGATARGPWRQSTPSWRAMRACRWRCSCCFIQAARRTRTPLHATYSRGLVLEEPPSAGSLGTMCKAGPSGRTGGLPPARARCRRRGPCVDRPGRVRPAGGRRRGLCRQIARQRRGGRSGNLPWRDA